MDSKELVIRMLWPIEVLYLHADYILVDEQNKKKLSDSFYNLAIKLTKELNIPDESFDYYKKNFCAYQAINVGELIGALEFMRDNPERNDSRYTLGFRSISTILDINKDKISFKDVCVINEYLQPFYDNYKYPALFLNGCGILPEYD